MKIISESKTARPLVRKKTCWDTYPSILAAVSLLIISNQTALLEKYNLKSAQILRCISGVGKIMKTNNSFSLYDQDNLAPFEPLPP